MGTTTRNFWHLGFVNIIRARTPASISVQPEVLLNVEPQRADMLLLRREAGPWHDDDAHVTPLGFE